MRLKANVHNSISRQRGISESVDLGLFPPLLLYTIFVGFVLPRRTRALQ